MDFKDFYSKIRVYYSSNANEYDRFKVASTSRKKLGIILKSGIMRDALSEIEGNLLSLNYVSNDNEESINIFNPREAEENRLVQELISNPKCSKDYPFISKKVDIKFSKKKGRHLVAKERIFTGEVVIAERPYVTILYDDFAANHCQSCFIKFSPEQSLFMRECKRCRQVKYCSEVCMTSNERLHTLECGYTNLLQSKSIGRMALLVYRTLIKTGFEQVLSTSKNEERNPKYDAKDFTSVFEQISHEDVRDPGEIFKRLCVAIFITNALRCKSFYPISLVQSCIGPAFFEQPDIIEFILTTLRLLQSNSCNAYEVNELNIYQSTCSTENSELGGAIYTTISLSNHSCVPNTTRNSHSNLGILRAATIISPGDEITDNYGHYYLIKDRSVRSPDLKKQYFFDCNCRACREDWPTFAQIRSLKMETEFTCSGCKAILPTNIGLAGKCQRCKKGYNLHKLKKKLESFDGDVGSTIRDLLVLRQNVEPILTYFQTLLNEMENQVRHPDSKYILCQQVISQCYGIKGNCYFKA
ncbi:SET and MYND domain-containing protein 4 [Lepeophtheirus salmonis]|uniref:SET and MYND domain-containing protein 4 n=1 Tax=Lepeophtheirus salmonis TaxID=72036 RepID=UPI001AE898AC|nr:SET and MYND domain-containing protein 4-like [Lepeophtheirus salmonis]